MYKNSEIVIEKFRNLISNEYQLLSFEKVSLCYKAVFLKDASNFTLTFFIKPITNAYLSYATDVNRIIVPVIKEISATKKDSAFLLVGYANVNENDVFVFWDPQRFTHHKTNRSVYIHKDNYEKAQKVGFVTGKDYSNRFYACTKNNFGKAIDKYIEDTYLEESLW